ncbi:PqqD family protein [Microbacterium sp. A20]|uniref:PqqD family protein n=1 Tax=Microbacterium sp. A20 TaxID=2305450 RepID=UPI00197BF2D0|nr:PqqD family protein [Microbacterium sp. A20]
MNSVDRNPDVVAARSAGATHTMLTRPSSNVSGAVIEQHCGELWLLHATAVADSSGNVVVAMSPSRDDARFHVAIKHLSRRFFCVGTDAVGIDHQAGVTLIRTRSRDANGTDERGTSRVPASLVDDEMLPSTLRLAKIILLDGDDEHPLEPVVESLDLGESLELLAPRSPFLAQWPAPLRAVASILTASQGSVRVAYRDAETLIPVVERLMASGLRATVSSVRPRSARGTAALPATDDALFRAATADSVELPDGRTAVLGLRGSDERLRILDEVSSVVWRAADGSPHAALRRAVLRQLDPQHANTDAAAVDQAIQSLRDVGMLSRTPAWRIGDSSVWTTHAAQTYVLNTSLTHTRPLALQGSAHTVWEVLASQPEISQELLIRECALAFGTDAEHIEADIVRLLADLSEQGVISQS